MFVNNYGYDFQITNNDELKRAIIHPKKSDYLNNYFKLFDEYHLNNNKQVKNLKKISNNIV